MLNGQIERNTNNNWRCFLTSPKQFCESFFYRNKKVDSLNTRLAFASYPTFSDDEWLRYRRQSHTSRLSERLIFRESEATAASAKLDCESKAAI